jgi:hypothetical protein
MAQDLALAIVERAMAVSKECILKLTGELAIKYVSYPIETEEINVEFDVPTPYININVYGGTKKRIIFEILDHRNIYSKEPTHLFQRTGDLKVELNKHTIKSISNYLNNILQRCFEMIEHEDDNLEDDDVNKDDKTYVRPFISLKIDDNVIYHRDKLVKIENKELFNIEEWIKDLYTILMYYEL